MPIPAELPILKIVTFNVACGHLFTCNRGPRMDAIGTLLADIDPDVVLLQEVFTRAGRDRLLAALAGSRLRHLADFPAGVVGNGMLTLSAWPIAGTAFHRFVHGSPFYKVHQGDWWAGKGVGLTRLALPGTMLHVYNTHAQPDRGDAANRVARARQMEEMADFILATRPAACPVIAAGDFNAIFAAPEVKSLAARAGLQPLVAAPDSIDLILGAGTPALILDCLEEGELAGSAAGDHAAIFLDRAPYPGEFWRMHLGRPETTALSDHPGYFGRIRLRPRLPEGSDGRP